MLTRVTNRLKLLDIRGTLNVSLLVLSSLGTPGPKPLPPGNLGKLGGKRELRSMSETLLVMDDEEGTPNFRDGAGGGEDEGGKEGNRLIRGA